VTEKPQQHNEVAGLLLFVRIFSTSDTNKKKKNGLWESKRTEQKKAVLKIKIEEERESITPKATVRKGRNERRRQVKRRRKRKSGLSAELQLLLMFEIKIKTMLQW